MYDPASYNSYIFYLLLYIDQLYINMLLSWHCTKANAKNLEEFLESLPNMGLIISFLLPIGPRPARPLPLLLKSTALEHATRWLGIIRRNFSTPRWFISIHSVHSYSTISSIWQVSAADLYKFHCQMDTS